MVYFKICFSSRNSFCEDFFKVFTPAIQIQNKKACNHKASLYESVTTVFNFTRPLGGFSSGENCVSAAVNHTIYGASTKLSPVGLANLQRILCF